MHWLNLLTWITAGGAFTLLDFFALTSWRERERRAAQRAAILAIVLPLPYLATTLLPVSLQAIAQVVLLAIPAIGLLLALYPGHTPAPRMGLPSTRVDERDIIFARMRLSPGMPEYQAYYIMRPENKEIDDRLRARPGLLSPDALFYNPLTTPAADASFRVIESMRARVDGPVAKERIPVTAETITPFIKELTKYWGARDVGITELRDYHLYTHIGRGDGVYGAPITLNHKYAIAFTVEMSYEMVSAAPRTPAIMESAREYLEAARIALQLAEYIRLLGYPARAHIDGNYRVIAPLVAWDAGLGEIGRMGLLMTPDLGPRVRINVVTTDLPLVPDGRRPDPGMIDFCLRCRKCAENCPSKAIPLGDPIQEGEVVRWKINPEACYRYWATVGTDCAICMRVCPYSHPDTLAHNLVRMAIRRSELSRIAALAMDDFFYGRWPSPRIAHDWLPEQEQQSSSRRRGRTR
ncbi:MAG: 4Fe-4S dicluster domain-containing protein [Anaerolineae bacterium]|nr:4Fe-4S dicluster domain-containing protein [Anaerolineae bacterium]